MSVIIQDERELDPKVRDKLAQIRQDIVAIYEGTYTPTAEEIQTYNQTEQSQTKLQNTST